MTTGSLPRRYRKAHLLVWVAVALLLPLLIAGAIVGPSKLWAALDVFSEPIPPVLPPTPSPSNPPDEQQQTVQVYFLTEGGNAYDGSAYRPVERSVSAEPTTQALVEGALREWLKGTTEEEESQSIEHHDPLPNDLIRSVSFESGQATVDFGEEPLLPLLTYVGTSYGGARFLTELDFTIFQFDEVEQIIFQLEGGCEAFWERFEVDMCQVVTRAVLQH